MRILSKLDEAQLTYLQDSLQELEYGSIVITVHDGYITQIDTTEKKRFTKQTSIQKSRNLKRK